MATPSALQALSILRDASQFKWYIIPLLLVVIYVYAVEIEKKNWSAVIAGLAFWGMDWINEIWNGLVFHFTNYAPVWGEPANTAYLILIGLNIETCFMFAIMGIVSTKMLTMPKEKKILKIPNRIIVAIGMSILCVIVEELLHAAGALSWDYSWWNAGTPWLIFLIGYLPFWLVAYWIYDMKTMKSKIITVGIIFLIVAIGLIVFLGILHWI